MSEEPCIEATQRCLKCWEFVTACVTHDEYFVCAECGCRMPIDKAQFKRRLTSMFNKVYGEKPNEPENN